MWTLTGFADEIAPELSDQLALLTTLGPTHLEFRSNKKGAPTTEATR